MQLPSSDHIISQPLAANQGQANMPALVGQVVDDAENASQRVPEITREEFEDRLNKCLLVKSPDSFFEYLAQLTSDPLHPITTKESKRAVHPLVFLLGILVAIAFFSFVYFAER